MRKFIIFFALFASPSLWAAAMQTYQTFDMYVEGDGCLVRAINEAGKQKLVKSISLIYQHGNHLRDVDGYFIPGINIPRTANLVEITPNGEVLVDSRTMSFKIPLEATKGVSCRIKQGFLEENSFVALLVQRASIVDNHGITVKTPPLALTCDVLALRSEDLFPEKRAFVASLRGYRCRNSGTKHQLSLAVDDVRQFAPRYSIEKGGRWAVRFKGSTAETIYSF